MTYEEKNQRDTNCNTWKQIKIATEEDGPTPDYETRLALVKLLLETAMYDEAFTVLNGLIEENDQVPDTLYLFGWANYIAAEEVDESSPTADEDRKEQLENAREALNACVKVRKREKLLSIADLRPFFFLVIFFLDNNNVFHFFYLRLNSCGT